MGGGCSCISKNKKDEKEPKFLSKAEWYLIKSQFNLKDLNLDFKIKISNIKIKSL
jgi:hypothetical protein